MNLATQGSFLNTFPLFEAEEVLLSFRTTPVIKYNDFIAWALVVKDNTLNKQGP